MDSENTLVSRIREFVINIISDVVLKIDSELIEIELVHVKKIYLRKSRELVVYGPDCFLDGFFERATNSHNFTDTLHAAAEEPADTVELLEIPARDLHHDVIQAGLEARARDLRD